MLTVRSEIHEGEIIGTAALITGPDQSVLVDTEVTSFTVKMFDLGDTNALSRRRPLFTQSITVATTNTNANQPGTPLIWNTSATPRNDGYWRGPSPGYNFLFFVDATILDAGVPPVVLKGGHKYRIEYVFTTDWDEITLVHEVTVAPRNTA